MDNSLRYINKPRGSRIHLTMSLVAEDKEELNETAKPPVVLPLNSDALTSQKAVESLQVPGLNIRQIKSQRVTPQNSQTISSASQRSSDDSDADSGNGDEQNMKVMSIDISEVEVNRVSVVDRVKQRVPIARFIDHRFSFTIAVQSLIGQPKCFGEEALISRFVVLQDSVLEKFFKKKLLNATIYFAHDEQNSPKDGDKSVQSTIRQRSTTTQAIPSYDSTPKSKASGFLFSDLLSGKNMAQSTSKKASFSVAVEVFNTERKKQIQSEFLRRASKKAKQLSLLSSEALKAMDESQSDDSSNSDSSEDEYDHGEIEGSAESTKKEDEPQEQIEENARQSEIDPFKSIFAKEEQPKKLSIIEEEEQQEKMIQLITPRKKRKIELIQSLKDKERYFSSKLKQAKEFILAVYNEILTILSHSEMQELNLKLICSMLLIAFAFISFLFLLAYLKIKLK